MSREIKFRIWSYEDKQYRTDCNLTRIFNSMTGTPATVYSDEGDRFDIEQSTGLKDKNGREIYEGDIVQDSKGVKCRVEWDTREAQFGLYVGKQMKLTDFIWMRGEDLDVIGSIHENPELLDEDINALNKEGKK